MSFFSGLSTVVVGSTVEATPKKDYIIFRMTNEATEALHTQLKYKRMGLLNAVTALRTYPHEIHEAPQPRQITHVGEQMCKRIAQYLIDYENDKKAEKNNNPISNNNNNNNGQMNHINNNNNNNNGITGNAMSQANLNNNSMIQNINMNNMNPQNTVRPISHYPRFTEVETWLDYHKMGEYKSLFSEAGYDDILACTDFTQDEIKALGITKQGHIKLLTLASQKLKTSLEEPFNLPASQSSANSSQNQLSCSQSEDPIPRNSSRLAELPVQLPQPSLDYAALFTITTTTEYFTIKNETSQPLPKITEEVYQRMSNQRNIQEAKEWFSRNPNKTIPLKQKAYELQATINVRGEHVATLTFKQAHSERIEKFGCSCNERAEYGVCIHVQILLEGLIRESRIATPVRNLLKASVSNRHKDEPPVFTLTPSLIDSGTTKSNNNSKHAPSSPTAVKTGRKKEYRPGYRTGGWAILIALYLNRPATMRKEDIITQAGPHCNASFTPTSSRVFTAWDGNKLLLEKGLIFKKGHPLEFGLTPAGAKLAEELFRENTRLSQKGDEYVPTVALSSESQERYEVDWTLEAKKQKVEGEMIPFEGKPFPSLQETKEYEVVCLVDQREYKSQELMDGLVTRNVKTEERTLAVGDYQFIARPRDATSHRQEIPLHYVIERKKTNDFFQSLTDSRYLEQKYRLGKSGIQNIIYLIEGTDQDAEVMIGTNAAVLQSEMLKTKLIDGFFVKNTSCEAATLNYISNIYTYCVKTMKNSQILMVPNDYIAWSSKLSKRRHNSVSEIFMRQLVAIPKVTPEIAETIVINYPTPMLFLQALARAGSDDEKINFLKDLNTKAKTKKNNLRKIGRLPAKEIIDFYFRGPSPN